MRTPNIADKVVVITGAGGGIGESTARLLAGSGAKVVAQAPSSMSRTRILDGTAPILSSLIVPVEDTQRP